MHLSNKNLIFLPIRAKKRLDIQTSQFKKGNIIKNYQNNKCDIPYKTADKNVFSRHNIDVGKTKGGACYELYNNCIKASEVIYYGEEYDERNKGSRRRTGV